MSLTLSLSLSRLPSLDPRVRLACPSLRLSTFPVLFWQSCVSCSVCLVFLPLWHHAHPCQLCSPCVSTPLVTSVYLLCEFSVIQGQIVCFPCFRFQVFVLLVSGVFMFNSSLPSLGYCLVSYCLPCPLLCNFYISSNKRRFALSVTVTAKLLKNKQITKCDIFMWERMKTMTFGLDSRKHRQRWSQQHQVRLTIWTSSLS